MNNVLFTKHEPLSPWFSASPTPVNHHNTRQIHMNIDLDSLSKFYTTHSFYMGLWTTSRFKNALKFFEPIKKCMKIEFDCFLSQENCSIGEMIGNIKTIHCIKDLRKPGKLLKVDLEKCILIDDSIGKRCEDQNLLLFDCNERDMIKAIKAIDSFIGCTDEFCIAKTL